MDPKGLGLAQSWTSSSTPTQNSGRIQKVDPLMGGSYKVPFSSIGPQIRGSTF